MNDQSAPSPCPLCGSVLVHCPGHPEMPASQEYWACRACGLNAHASRLLSAAARDELRAEYEAALRRRVDEGREAARRLATAGATSDESSTDAFLLTVAAAGLLGLAIAALLRR